MTTNATAGPRVSGRPGTPTLSHHLELIVNQTDPTAAIYDALAGLQGGPHHLPPGTRQAIAEHLAATLPAVPAVVSPPTDRAADEVDADTVASRAAQVITTMGADIRALTGQRDRYRTAWRSARERAQAHAEGTLRHVADRDFWKRQHKAEHARHVEVVGALVTDRATGLSEAERTMLTYALDQAQEKIWSEDGFTNEDQDAVDSLRRLAAGAHSAGAQQQEAEEPRCDAGFVFGGRCTKPAGHDDPHVTAPVAQQPVDDA